MIPWTSKIALIRNPIIPINYTITEQLTIEWKQYMHEIIYVGKYIYILILFNYMFH